MAAESEFNEVLKSARDAAIAQAVAFLPRRQIDRAAFDALPFDEQTGHKLASRMGWSRTEFGGWPIIVYLKSSEKLMMFRAEIGGESAIERFLLD